MSNRVKDSVHKMSEYLFSNCHFEFSSNSFATDVRERGRGKECVCCTENELADKVHSTQAQAILFG